MGWAGWRRNGSVNYATALHEKLFCLRRAQSARTRLTLPASRRRSARRFYTGGATRRFSRPRSRRNYFDGTRRSDVLGSGVPAETVLSRGGIECPVCPQSCGRSTGAAGCKICGGPPARLGIECGIARYSRCGFGDGDVQTNAAGRTGDAACGGRFLTGSNDRRGDEIIRRNSYLVNAANLATSRTMLVLLKKQ